MNTQFLTILLTTITLTSFAQTPEAEALNAQSKKHLQAGEIEKAIPLLKKAAEMGNAEAQYNLRYCYQSGTGIEKNSKTAVEWYAKSAEQGFNDALYQMMMAYGNGDGVEQNPEKAFAFALKCAENNDATCMWNVVNCYYQGMGVKKDLDTMLAWATRLGKLENPENLARSGNITSTRLQLAYMYRDGKDIQQDLFKSYQWFLIYNEYKIDFSVLQQEQVINEIKDLESKLTTGQKANAPKEAEKLLGRPLKNLGNLYKADF
jgi:uncharacterized protein